MITIDKLPDEVLLAIFDFYVDKDSFKRKEVETWQSLVHVCRRWRSVVFGSPRRLNLRLVCQAETSVRDRLDVWPPLPLVVWDSLSEEEHVDNIVAVLERSDRVCQIDLGLIYGISSWVVVLTPMQKTFPELTDLVLYSHCPMATFLPNSFLGGSAPRLRKLRLDGVSFPGLPNLLLSAAHLVKIQLHNIHYFSHFSPDEWVTVFSTLTSLRLLSLNFLSPRSRSDQKSRCPPTRSLLPNLDTLQYEGVSEYLDNLVAHIDAPGLKNLVINFDEDILDASQITQFIGRTPAFEALKKAHVPLDGAGVKLSSETSGYRGLEVNFLCVDLFWQLSSLKRFCTSCLPLSALEDLYISENIYPRPIWADDAENILWPELLHPFTSVKNLYLSEDIVPRIPPTLQELVVDSTTEVLPMAQNIFLGGLQPRRPIPEGIEKLIAARQLSGQPVTVSTIPLRERDSMPGWVVDFK